jgi:HK97 gp10 family phage protein
LRMIQIDIQQRGLDISVLACRMDSDLLPNVVEQLLDYGYADMMSRVPVRTGRLMASIQKENLGLQGSLGPTEPYAVYVEYGTSSHEIRPIFAHVLRFEAGGGIVFTPLVHHPGTRPQPFVEQTAQDMVGEVANFWSEAFGEATGQ